MDAIRAELAADNLALRNAIEWKDAAFQALRTKHEVLCTVHAELCGENEMLRRDVVDLKADLVMADQVNQSLHAKIQSLMAAYGSLQAEVSGEVVDHSCLEGTCDCPKLDPWVEECEPPLNTFGVRGS